MKTKWFTANFPAGLDGLYQAIINTPFDSDKGWGFSILSYEDSIYPQNILKGLK